MVPLVPIYVWASEIVTFNSMVTSKMVKMVCKVEKIAQNGLKWAKFKVKVDALAHSCS